MERMGKEERIGRGILGGGDDGAVGMLLNNRTIEQ